MTPVVPKGVFLVLGFILYCLVSETSADTDADSLLQSAVSNNADFETIFFNQHEPLGRHKRDIIGKKDETKASVTFEEQVNFLRWHNGFRKNVSPNATDMQQMTWDLKLAAMAQAWADRCVWKHGNPDGMENPYSWVGQNMWAGSTKYHETSAVKNWYNEVRYYSFGKGCQSGKVCGHYKQVVWNKSHALGCGIKFCPQMDGLSFTNAYFIVCNYGPGGNIRGSLPYEKGNSCSNCPSEKPKCVDRLCTTDPVCNGLTCSGSDSLIVDVCECGDPDIGEIMPDDIYGGSAGGLSAFSGSMIMVMLCMIA